MESALTATTETTHESPCTEAHSTNAAGGLQPGVSAPDFTLPRVGGGICSLSNDRGRRVLLAFVEARSQGCRDVAAELNRIQRSGKLQVLAILHGTPYEAALWADGVLAAFPVLVDAFRNVSEAYDISRTPRMFLIDESARIVESNFVTRSCRLHSRI